MELRRVHNSLEPVDSMSEMTCPRCGQPVSVQAVRCPSCHVALGHRGVASETIAIDTTGLPPGGTFAPMTGSADTGSDAAAQDALTPTPLPPTGTVAVTGAIGATGATAATAGNTARRERTTLNHRH